LAATLNGMLGALERAREAERRFLADASHELRTPLTALVGNVAYLARYGASEELVAELEQDSRRLAKLADDLLALSREEAAPRPGRDRGSGSRSCARPPSATAAAPTSRAPASRSSCRLSELSQSPALQRTARSNRKDRRELPAQTLHPKPRRPRRRRARPRG